MTDRWTKSGILGKDSINMICPHWHEDLSTTASKKIGSCDKKLFRLCERKIAKGNYKSCAYFRSKKSFKSGLFS